MRSFMTIRAVLLVAFGVGVASGPILGCSSSDDKLPPLTAGSGGVGGAKGGSSAGGSAGAGGKSVGGAGGVADAGSPASEGGAGPEDTAGASSGGAE
jgi:hypothetical protein